MSDAIRIEQRLLNLFAGRRGAEDEEQEQKRPQRHESPREMEQRTVEHLYGRRSGVVTLVDDDPDGE